MLTDGRNFSRALVLRLTRIDERKDNAVVAIRASPYKSLSCGTECLRVGGDDPGDTTWQAGALADGDGRAHGGGSLRLPGSLHWPPGGPCSQRSVVYPPGHDRGA